MYALNELQGERGKLATVEVEAQNPLEARSLALPLQSLPKRRLALAAQNDELIDMTEKTREREPA